MSIQRTNEEMNGASVTPTNEVPHSSGQDHVPPISPLPTTLRTAVADYHQSKSNWDSAARDSRPNDIPDELQTELSEGTTKAIGDLIESTATNHDELTLKMSILIDMMTTGLDDFPDGGHGQADLAKSIFADMQRTQNSRAQTSVDAKENQEEADPDVSNTETSANLREKVDRDASDIEAISKLLIAADSDPDLIPSTMFLHDALHEKATRMSSALDKLQLQAPHQHA